MGFSGEDGRLSNSVFDPFTVLARQDVFESYFRHEVSAFPGPPFSPVYIEQGGLVSCICVCDNRLDDYRMLADLIGGSIPRNILANDSSLPTQLRGPLE